MIRFLVNAVGSLILALALVFAVGDIARFLAQGTLRMTSLAQAFGSIGLPLEASEGVGGASVDLAALLGAWPAAPALGLLALLVLLVGRPRGGHGRALR